MILFTGNCEYGINLQRTWEEHLNSMKYVWWFEDGIEPWLGIIIFEDLWLETMDMRIMCMIHKSEFWLGIDSNPVVYKLASLEELIRISCSYDLKIYYWFHSYFEGFVYVYWEELDL